VQRAQQHEAGGERIADTTDNRCPCEGGIPLCQLPRGNIEKDKGSVLVDVAIDQGGCFKTSKATTHEDPTYIVEGIIHYCVANMPGGVARTSTFALNNATMPFVLEFANKGYHRALMDNAHLRNGLNVHNAMVTNAAVAQAQGYNYVEPVTALHSSQLKATA
jgi:alanine dehydrogenase